MLSTGPCRASRHQGSDTSCPQCNPMPGTPQPTRTHEPRTRIPVKGRAGIRAPIHRRPRLTRVNEFLSRRRMLDLVTAGPLYVRIGLARLNTVLAAGHAAVGQASAARTLAPPTACSSSTRFVPRIESQYHRAIGRGSVPRKMRSKCQARHLFESGTHHNGSLFTWSNHVRPDRAAHRRQSSR